MSDSSPVDGQEVNGILNRVNQLGGATERFFSRLYQTLSGRSKKDPKLPKRVEQKARMVAEKNQRLVRALRKREAEVERLNGILATIDEGIIMQDMDGRIVMINSAAQRLLGIQKNFWDSELGSLFDAYRDVVQVDAELAPLGEPTRVQVNNRILGAQLAAVADEEGKRLGTMIVLRDVTHDAVTDRLKDQFVTAISHELRTPMTVIKGAAEVLAGSPEDQPVNQRLLQTLTRNVDTLDRMVVELLDISEMGAGTFDIRRNPVKLEPLLLSVVTSVAAEIKRGRLNVQFMIRDADQLIVRGDEQRLRWAIGHVVQNGIRYTEAGGQIFVYAGIHRDDPNNVLIEFRDTGVGISDKDMPHVFERFYRGEPRTTSGKLLDPRGLGQGLFVARTVAEVHQGYLTVRSTVGEGTTFSLALPRADDVPQLDQPTEQ